MKFTYYIRSEDRIINVRKEINAKSMGKAFDLLVKLHGAGNFFLLKRDLETYRHKDYFLKRAISNITKHIHKTNRRGFK